MNTHLDCIPCFLRQSLEAVRTVTTDAHVHEAILREVRRLRADLIIAKGQGNFETLSSVARNIFFLFKIKCEVVSNQVGLPFGTHALFHQQVVPTKVDRR